MARKVTIEDIARKSDASITTVSMVLRDKPGIGADTRQRVLAVARELGYQRRVPLEHASGTPLTVGMILRSRTRSATESMPSVNDFYSWVVTGIESAARASRTNLLYATIPVDDTNRPLDVPTHLLNQSLAGIMIVGSFSSETVADLVSSRTTPAVLVDGPAIPSRHDAVVSDNQGGASDAVRSLIGFGHRHIALLGPDIRLDPNFNQRRDGYEQAMLDRGLDMHHIQVKESGPSAVTTAIAAALDRDPELTAIFACNDGFAIEAIQSLRKLGRSVPGDVSVIGFDDIAQADQMTPRLTTMAVDKVTMGRLAMLMLNHRLAWSDASPALTILRPALRMRESVRAVDQDQNHEQGAINGGYHAVTARLPSLVEMKE